MARWTTTPQEYAHVRSIIVDGPIYGKVIIGMQDGRQIPGLLLGASSGNNVSENLDAGRGPIVTSIWGELSVQIDERKMITLDALDVAYVVQNSN